MPANPPAHTPPRPLRSPTGSGRPYAAEIVAGVRALVEAGLSYHEAAARSGIGVDAVGRWARRDGWRRGEPGGADITLPWRGRVGPEVRGGVMRGSGDLTPLQPGDRVSPHPAGFAVDPPPPGEGNEGGVSSSAPSEPRHPGRYGPAVREAARVRVEGSRDGTERIAKELGIARQTLIGWQKRFGWRRPAPPAKSGPAFFRSRRFGRAYGGDAVGTARDLVTGSRLPIRRIAARAGVSRATLYRWIERRGWTRATVGRHPYRPPYPPGVVAAARELYEGTGLSTRMIAARAKATPERVAHWARTQGWTRPREMPRTIWLRSAETQRLDRAGLRRPDLHVAGGAAPLLQLTMQVP